MDKEILRDEVELQLEELLENRPNEEKEPHRRRNRMKDIKKDALRGNQRLKWILLDEKVEELRNKKIKEYKEYEEDRVIVECVRLEDKVIRERIPEMLSREEIAEQYRGYSVTQNKYIRDYGTSENGNIWFDVVIQLTAKRRIWGIDILRYKGDNVRIGNIFGGYGMTELTSKENTLENLEGKEYTLEEFKREVRYYLSEDVYDWVVEDIEKRLLRRLDTWSSWDLRVKAYNYLDEEDKEMVRFISNHGKRSKWYDKKYIYLNRSKLKGYLKKELERDGDFELTHHRTDLFEETDWIY